MSPRSAARRKHHSASVCRPASARSQPRSISASTSLGGLQPPKARVQVLGHAADDRGRSAVRASPVRVTSPQGVRPVSRRTRPARPASASSRLHSMNGSCWSPPICTRARWVKPASAYSFAASRTASTSSPHGIALGDVLLADELAGRVEGRRAGQLGVDLPAEAEPAEQRVRAGDGGGLVGAEADRHLADPRLARAAGGVEHLAELGLRLDGDHHVGELAGDLAGLLARRRRRRSAPASPGGPRAWPTRRRSARRGSWCSRRRRTARG